MNSVFFKVFIWNQSMKRNSVQKIGIILKWNKPLLARSRVNMADIICWHASNGLWLMANGCVQSDCCCCCWLSKLPLNGILRLVNIELPSLAPESVVDDDDDDDDIGNFNDEIDTHCIGCSMVITNIQTAIIVVIIFVNDINELRWEAILFAEENVDNNGVNVDVDVDVVVDDVNGNDDNDGYNTILLLSSSFSIIFFNLKSEAFLSKPNCCCFCCCCLFSDCNRLDDKRWWIFDDDDFINNDDILMITINNNLNWKLNKLGKSFFSNNQTKTKKNKKIQYFFFCLKIWFTKNNFFSQFI